MPLSFIKGVARSPPNVQVTFGKFHVIAHASYALDLTCRAKARPGLQGLLFPALKDSRHLSAVARKNLHAFMADVTTKRTARE